MALLAAAAVVQLYQHTHDRIWPGYDLSRLPFVIYIPDRWTVLLNAKGPIAGFEEHPRCWMDLGTTALYHPGRFDNAVGQLLFNLQLDSLNTIAVPFSPDIGGSRGGAIGNGFAFITHEAFHQYQYGAFRSMEDAGSEEEYPILDAENMALATLEMRILMDALRASVRNERGSTAVLASEFVAVREKRWGRGSPFIARFERTQELHEGSAKYVEVRSIGTIGELCRDSTVSPPIPASCAVFAPVTAAAYLLDDFESRLSEQALDPRDVARNRTYPVGATLGILLDFFGVDWKLRVAQGSAETETSLTSMLKEGLPAVPVAPESLLARAERRYDYARIRAVCDELANEYPRQAQAAIDAFEGQPGRRITVELPISGMTRSRSCRGGRWVLEGGRDVLSKECAAYSVKPVKGTDLVLEVQHAGLLEQDNQAAGTRQVSFFAPDIAEMELDGRPLSASDHGPHRYARIVLTGANFRFDSKRGGTITLEGMTVSVRAVP